MCMCALHVSGLEMAGSMSLLCTGVSPAVGFVQVVVARAILGEDQVKLLVEYGWVVLGR